MSLIVNPGRAVDSLVSDIGGTLEGFTVTVPNTASAAQADYFSFSEPDGDTYAVYLDIDAANVVPTGAIYVAAARKVEIEIVTGGSSGANAAAVKAAIEADASLNEYDITINGAVLSFVAKRPGNPADAAPHNENDAGAGSIGVSITKQGTDPFCYPAGSPADLSNNP
jgi:hypothetical protein